MHLAMLAQIGNAGDNGAEHQWNHHHFEQVDKQGAHQVGSIQGVIDVVAMRTNPQHYRKRRGKKDLPIESEFLHVCKTTFC